jgi:hypothetical protein
MIFSMKGRGEQELHGNDAITLLESPHGHPHVRSGILKGRNFDGDGLPLSF